MLRFDQGQNPPPSHQRTSLLSCLGTIAAVIGGFIFMGALAIGVAFLLGLFDGGAEPAQSLAAYSIRWV